MWNYEFSRRVFNKIIEAEEKITRELKKHNPNLEESIIDLDEDESVLHYGNPNNITYVEILDTIKDSANMLEKSTV